ncbi:MAG: M23 family metallopeptidase [Ruminiclostridium sp.]|nr:M23 family metallopeptidase [Ruminiclostridium sp.]
MSKGKFNLANIVKMAIAAVRAAYGDYTGVAVEGASLLARAAKYIFIFIIGLLLLFTILIGALIQSIPGFKQLYELYRHFNPPSYSTVTAPAVSPIPTDVKMYFPIPSGNAASFSYTNGDKRSHEGIDIFTDRNTPLIAIEDLKIIKIGWDSIGGWMILLESLDGNRRYYYAHLEKYCESLEIYRDMTGAATDPVIIVNAGDVLGYVGSSGDPASDSSPGADTGVPPHLHFELWLRQKDKYILVNPYQFLKLLEVNKFILSENE